MIISIFIPEDSRCFLKIGDKIDFGKVFLEKKINQQTDILISKQLNIVPKNIFRYLKKLVGDEVKKDEVIAVKKDLFNEKKILSPFDGLIKEIDHEQGKITLTINEKTKKTFTAFFKGEVVDLKKDHFNLEIGKGDAFDLKKTELSFGGETLYLREKDISNLNSLTVNKKIIVTESISPFVQSKIEALGAIGIITSIKPSETTAIPTSQIKNSNDLKKIFANKFSYCFIDKQSCKIYFYQ